MLFHSAAQQFKILIITAVSVLHTSQYSNTYMVPFENADETIEEYDELLYDCFALPTEPCHHAFDVPTTRDSLIGLFA